MWRDLMTCCLRQWVQTSPSHVGTVVIALLTLGVLQVDVGELPLESTQMKEVAEMLKDIRQVRATSLGEQHVSVAEAACVVSLLFICLRDSLQADQALREAQQVLAEQDATSGLGLMLRTAQAGVQHAVTAP